MDIVGCWILASYLLSTVEHLQLQPSCHMGSNSPDETVGKQTCITPTWATREAFGSTKMAPASVYRITWKHSISQVETLSASSAKKNTQNSAQVELAALFPEGLHCTTIHNHFFFLCSNVLLVEWWWGQGVWLNWWACGRWRWRFDADMTNFSFWKNNRVKYLFVCLWGLRCCSSTWYGVKMWHKQSLWISTWCMVVFL